MTPIRNAAALGKPDANQAEIVRALEAAGAVVIDLHAVGGGCPDLMVGFRGRNYCLEVKTATGKLRPDQQEFFDTWAGQAAVVRTVEAALEFIGAAEYNIEARIE